MGLSGRKQKQRIPNDPRNLAWADDASKFGQAYLSKFGWDASKGLGVAGEGRLSHVKVSQKLDMLGIGAAQQRDPDGIAWKQNKDFEALLARLNGQPAEAGAATTAVSGFHAESKGLDQDGKVEERAMEVGEVKEKKKDKKRKREEDDGEPKKKKKRKGSDDEDSESDKKKRKKDKKEKKSQKSKKSRSDEPSQDDEAPSADTPQDTPPTTTWIPRVKAHRARFLASKNIATKSATAIAEILGVSRTPSTQPSSRTDSPMAALTPITDDAALNDGITTTSTKSVSDYLKARLSSKSKLSGVASSLNEDIGKVKDEKDEEVPRMRMGLGMGSSMLNLFSSPVDDDESAQKVGLSAFSSLRTSAFLNASSTVLPSSFPDAATSLDPSDLKKEEQDVLVPKAEKKKKKSKKDKIPDAVEPAEQESSKKEELEEAALEQLNQRNSTSHWSEDESPGPSKEERKAAKVARNAEKERKKQLKAAKREKQS